MVSFKLKFILTIVILSTISLVLYLVIGHQFLIYTDSYEYLLIAKNLTQGSHTLDFYYGHHYFSSSILLSREGYSMLIGLISSIFKNSDLINLATLINLSLFSFNLSLISYWGIIKSKLNLQKFIIIIIFCIFSYANIFWLKIVISDYLVQTILLVTTLYALGKYKEQKIEVLLIFLMMLVRVELLLVVYILLIGIKGNKLVQIIRVSIYAVILQLGTYYVLVQNKLEFLRNSYQLIANSTIDPWLLLILLVILLTIFLTARKLNYKFSLIHLIYLMFLAYGIVFADIHNLTGTLNNGFFLILHDLPLISVAVGLSIFSLYNRKSSRNSLILLSIFFSSLFVYHFYFQHLVIFIPLVIIAAIELAKDIPLKLSIKKTTGALILLLLISLPLSYMLLAFANYSITKPDSYSDLFSHPEISDCFNSKTNVSFLLPSLYYEFGKKENIVNWSINSQALNLNPNENYLFAQYNLRTEITNYFAFNKVLLAGTIMIDKSKRYDPIVYYKCQ